MASLQIDIVDPKAEKLLNDLADMNLILIKSVAAPLEKNIYPFKTQYLKHGNTSYILREKISGSVSYADGQYIISNKSFDITVWGISREDAEEAFAFTFHALYENFAKGKDSNLAASAKKLKKKLLNLVVNVNVDNEG